MSDPNGTGGMSVTLKQDGRDSSWMVFHGSVERISEDIIKTFGMDPEKSAELDLCDLAHEAQALYKAVGNAGRTLGARAGGSGAWAAARNGAESAPAEPEKNPLFDTIAAMTDVAELRNLWAENRPIFDATDGDGPELLAAWKAKGKELSAA